MQTKLKGISNKRLFCQEIGTNLKEAEYIIANIDKFYSEITVGKPGKQRVVQKLNPRLSYIHTQIKKLFDELPAPDNLYSGVKGRSYISNAYAHLSNNSFKKMDIKGFYKSSKKEYLFRFLHFALEIPQDVAWFIVDLTTYKGVVPTGSPLSQQIAFWSHYAIFKEIRELTQICGITNTIYVDDLTFSSKNAIDPVLHLKVNRLLKTHELRLKRSKVESSSKKRTEITGIVVNPDGSASSPNRQKKHLFESLQAVNGDITLLDVSEFRSLIGVLRCIRSVEKGRFPMLYHEFVTREQELNRRKSQSRKDTARLAKIKTQIPA